MPYQFGQASQNALGSARIDVGGGGILPSKPQPGILRRVGEFLAPTTTGLITGEKEVTPQRLLGAGLEIGSFALPTGAIARGLGLAGKAAITTGRAAKAVTPLEQASRVATRLGTQAKISGAVGGISGGMFGAGRALGEEGVTPREVLGQAAIGAGVGAVGGAVLAPAISIATMGSRGVAKATSEAFRKVNRGMNINNKESAIKHFENAIDESWVKGATSGALNKLDDIVVTSGKTGGPKTWEGLRREVAEGGYIPNLRGREGKPDFTAHFEDLAAQRSSRALERGEMLRGVPGEVKLEDLLRQSVEKLRERTDIPFARGLNSLEQEVSSTAQRLRKTTLNFEELNNFIVEMNQRSAAFRKAQTAEKFIADVPSIIAKTANEVLESKLPQEISSILKIKNAEMSKLFRIEDVLNLFQNQKIDIGPIVSALGRYLGIAGLSGPAATLLGTLPVAGGAGILIAGFAAQMGTRFISGLIRNTRFNPRIQQLIRQTIQNEPKLLNELLEEATGADKAIIQGLIRQEPTVDLREVKTPSQQKVQPLGIQARIREAEPLRRQVEGIRPITTGRTGEIGVVTAKTVEQFYAKLPPQKLLSQISKTINEGGITFNIARLKNLGGTDNYAVGVFPIGKRTFNKIGNLTRTDLIKFIRDNADILSREEFNLGGWKDGKEVFLDISRVFSDRKKAEILGRRLNQKAITYLKDISDIPTGGTGKKLNLTEEQILKLIDQVERGAIGF